MKISTLELEWKQCEVRNGTTQIFFLDFIVNGESLYERFGGGLISPLGWFIQEQNTKVVNQFLLKENSDLSNNRYPLYVCAECGDLGCGAITAIIEKEENKIIWKDFGFQNDYEEEIQPVKYLYTLTFDEAQYRDAFRKAL